MWALALIIGLAPLLHAGSSAVPFVIQEMKSDRDVGAVNENFRAVTGSVRSLDKRLDDLNAFALSSSGGGAAPTRQIFTTAGSSGTYTTPSGVRQIRIRLQAGSGGAGSSYTGDGTPGEASYFGTVNVSSGLGGLGGTGSIVPGGLGGTGGVGPASLRIKGGDGCPGNPASQAGCGGNSPFGGSGCGNGISSNGRNGAPNSGSGASPGAYPAYVGSCSGAGEYAELIIDNPAASYPYKVGAGGKGGNYGGSHFAGGDGGSGVIIVDEFY